MNFVYVALDLFPEMMYNSQNKKILRVCTMIIVAFSVIKIDSFLSNHFLL